MQMWIYTAVRVDSVVASSMCCMPSHSFLTVFSPEHSFPCVVVRCSVVSLHYGVASVCSPGVEWRGVRRRVSSLFGRSLAVPTCTLPVIDL